jgi:hypothetical protein
MRQLDIPAHLTDRTDISLHHSYQKYKAYEDASTKLASMVADKLWLGRKPSSAELIEVFIAKTRFWTNYKPAFSRMAEYPEMEMWLNGDAGAGSDVEVWGYQKGQYFFPDLISYVKNGGPLVAKTEDLGKGKGKAKEVEEKEKMKRKAKDEGNQQKKQRRSDGQKRR